MPQNNEIYTRDEMKAKCESFYHALQSMLGEKYENVGSCNQDCSAYLVPIGTKDQISYSSKPLYSFRISDHWNLKANHSKNPDDNYIQCYTTDLPWTRKRPEPGKASPPIWAWSVCYFGEDQKYHCVYGEWFDRKSKSWNWMETTPESIVERISINV